MYIVKCLQAPILTIYIENAFIAYEFISLKEGVFLYEKSKIDL